MSLIASIGAFIPGLFGKELAFKTAKVLGIIQLAILAILILGIGKCTYDASVINQHEAEREVKAGAAREDAADQRVVDAIKNAQSEEELHDVIEAAPGGVLSPAAHALSCERLRRYGSVPPACRPQGGYRSEADTD